jgi:hypothetical protein
MLNRSAIQERLPERRKNKAPRSLIRERGR